MAIHNVSNQSELLAALSSAAPLDVIRLDPGNYGSPILDAQNGKFADFVTIESVDPLQAVFTGLTHGGAERLLYKDVTVDSAMVHGGVSKFIEYENCKLRGVGAHSAQDLRFYRCEVHSGQIALKPLNNVQEITRVTIEECDVHDVGNDLMQIEGGASFVDILNSVFYDTLPPNASAHTDMIQSFQQFSSGRTPDNIRLIGCVLVDNPLTGSQFAHGWFFGDAAAVGYTNVEVLQNMVYATMSFANNNDKHVGPNTRVEHNTILRGTLGIDGDSPGLVVDMNICPLLQDARSAPPPFTPLGDNIVGIPAGAFPTFDFNLPRNELWKNFVPVPGGPLDGTLHGASTRIAELQGQAPPPPPPPPPEPDMRTVFVTTLPTNGTITNISDPITGEIAAGEMPTYQRNAGYVGADSFQYHFTDTARPGEQSDTATVTLNVVDPLDAVEDTFNVVGDGPVPLDVLANDPAA